MRRLCLAIAVVATPCLQAQTLEPAPTIALIPASPMASSDRAMVLRADGQRQQIEDSVKDYLVAFDSRLAAPGAMPRKTVGLSLTNFSGSPLALAYDPNSKGMMAQWRSSQTLLWGQTIRYHAFVGQSGAVNFMISSRF